MADDKMTPEFTQEREVFQANYRQWLDSPQSAGRFVLIKHDEVVGFYGDLTEAFREGTARFGLEPFFIERIAPPPATNVTFLGQRF